MVSSIIRLPFRNSPVLSFYDTDWYILTYMYMIEYRRTCNYWWYEGYFHYSSDTMCVINNYNNYDFINTFHGYTSNMMMCKFDAFEISLET